MAIKILKFQKVIYCINKQKATINKTELICWIWKIKGSPTGRREKKIKRRLLKITSIIWRRSHEDKKNV